MTGYSDAFIAHEVKRKGLTGRDMAIREINSIARDILQHEAQIEALLERADILYERLGKPNGLRKEYNRRK